MQDLPLDTQGLFRGSQNLTKFPLEILQFVQLETLILHNNQLSTLPCDICRLVNLNFLQLSYNLFSSIPSELYNLPALRHLSFDGNQLTAIPPEIVKLTNLLSLALESNQISSIPMELGQMSNLKALILVGNKITTVPIELAQSTLQDIFLEQNPIVKIPEELYDQIHLDRAGVIRVIQYKRRQQLLCKYKTVHILLNMILTQIEIPQLVVEEIYRGIDN